MKKGFLLGLNHLHVAMLLNYLENPSSVSLVSALSVILRVGVFQA